MSNYSTFQCSVNDSVYQSFLVCLLVEKNGKLLKAFQDASFNLPYSFFSNCLSVHIYIYFCFRKIWEIIACECTIGNNYSLSVFMMTSLRLHPLFFFWTFLLVDFLFYFVYKVDNMCQNKKKNAHFLKESAVTRETK